jgi:hypothetical protein
MMNDIDKNEYLKQLKELAIIRDGVCFSDVYINAKTKLKWKCAKGHIWESTSHSVKNKHRWCPFCAGHIKGDLKELERIANERGGKCLSKKYINNKTPLLWECGKKHIWKAVPFSIKRGSWCPTCAGKNKTINEMRLYAKKRFGYCISDKYINAKTKLKWKCAKDHIWFATPQIIYNNSWCPICSRVKRSVHKIYDLTYANNLALKYNGKCVSVEVKNYRQLLEWECANKHIWFSKIQNIQKGNWCSICKYKIEDQYLNNNFSRMREPTIKSFADIINIIKTKNGKILEQNYKSLESKIKIECDKGHIWSTNFRNIMEGHWCHVCAGVVKLDFRDIQKIAIDRGGLCLSTEYINIDSKLEWQCAKNHRWFATPNQVIHSLTWCPYCNNLIMENISRVYLELYLNCRFIKTRPSWLRNERNKVMELDGFAENNMIAFEYNGKQHYEVGHFKNNEKILAKRMKDDKLKLDICNARGIKLLVIPYTLDISDLGKHIYNELKKLGYKPAISYEDLDYKSFNIYENHDMEILQSIAKQKGGRCLSANYVNANTKLQWECAKGHIWWAAPHGIKRGTWCPECGKKSKSPSIEFLSELAIKKGGKLLSSNYTPLGTMLTWECAKGHIGQQKHLVWRN